jgi:beta-aspartyl-peptidase (threonine type)
MTEPAIWTLVLHGGAGMMTRDRIDAQTDAGARAGLAAALDAGSAILARGGSALDAVEAAVRVLEDDPHFNAGRGAALSHEGVAELDAAIMAGRQARSPA